jgi:hypothetical protein
MNEFAEAIKILKDLGVIQIFSIPLAFLIFAFLFKKFLINGSMGKVGVFLKDVILDYMSSEKERIKVQASVEHSLEELCHKFDEIAEAMWDNRRLIDEQIKVLELALQTHTIETHNLLLLLKKQDGVNSMPLVETQYFKQEIKP